MTSPTARDAASFRDPSGYVFRKDGRIFRAIDAPCAAAIRELLDNGVLGRLITERRVVATSFVPEGDLLETLRGENPGYASFLEHEVVPIVTYPYEWSVSMLAEAAAATLDLQLRLLDAGFSLKDASAYNIQFIDGRPIFIDVSSIERPARSDIWFALGQFGRMFTQPLLLARYHGWDLRSYFLASLDGRSPEQVVRGLGLFSRWRPAMLLDVTLPAWFGRREEARPPSEKPVTARRDAGPAGQKANLARLRRKVLALAAGYRPSGVWAGYTLTCSYEDASETAKKAIVDEILLASDPRTVLDLGCNSGDYSFLAARGGRTVLAVDGDHDAIEVFYRRLRREPATIVPMVVDLGNPSPGIGFRNAERPPFLARAGADCVMALALLHHLVVAANLPLAAVRDFLGDLTRRDVILEFVPREDPMFRRLLRFRVDLFGDLDLARCRSVFLERFEVLAERAIPGSPRTLLHLRKRGR